ncbi:MAG TPA: hypothetical protein VLQ93_09325 [Myxococcaceae bacterium]|nr:hypothetical protein [Myxococcaceae bacterium]
MTPHGSPPALPRPPRRGRWLLLLVPLVLGLGGLLLSWVWVDTGPGRAQAASPAPVSTVSVPAPSRGLPLSAARSPAPSPPSSTEAAVEPAEAEREAQRKLWEARLERARFTLDSYVQSTRYPYESRPISEHPDQVHPAAPERAQALSREHPEISLRLKQEKVFVAGEEVVRFFVGCENARSGQALPCEVHSGVAHEAPHLEAATQLTSVPLDFNDAGRNGDELSGDGTWTASFQPARQGFALFSGTLRVEFRVRTDGGVEGGAFFDILVTAASPATFTGKVREVVEEGSLQLYLGLQVRKPGRYVVAGRVADEAGVPFAYVSFNEELEAGAREVKLTVFGRLLHDEAPSFPLQLRDVEGFLLLEQGDPDRELLATLSGYVHTTRTYPLEAFSEAEWRSEERQRHLDEFTRDVEKARQHLEELEGRGGGAPRAP